MARKKYFLDDNKTQELEIKWSMGWKETSVSLNSQLLAAMSKDDILAGKTIELPDQRKLEIKLEKGLFTTLTSKIDGKHIRGSMGDPVYQLKQVFYLMIFLGILNIVIGLIFHMNDIQIREFEGIGIANVIVGLVQIGLGYAISKGNMPALVGATVLMGLDLVLTAMYIGGGSIKSGIVFKIFIFLFIIRGFKYMKEFRQSQP